MFPGIADEVAADVITAAIFAFFTYYVLKKIKVHEKLAATLLISLGILVVVISDIIALIWEQTPIECIAGKVTAAGALVAALGILHSVTIYPKKNVVYRTLPSLYIISIIMIVYLFASPHFLYCSPTTGGEHGAFWDIYVLWVYIIFFMSAVVLFMRLFTAKVKIVRLRYLYMTLGVTITLVYLGVAQVVPIYVESVDYFTAVHILPIMGALFLISMLKYGMFVVTPTVERGGYNRGPITINDGEIAGISSVHYAYLNFREIITEEPGLIITIRPPNLLRERYLMKRTPMIWLTYFPGDYVNSIIPDRLHFEVMDAIINFIHEGGRAILIDATEYLIANFGRKFMLEFVEDIRAISHNTKIIMAIQEPSSIEGFADRIYNKSLTPPSPAVIMCKDDSTVPIKDSLIISTHPQNFREEWKEAKFLHLGNDFTVDRLIFEGIKIIEECERKNVYIESMDYILSIGNDKNVMNLLKDIIDVVIPKGGKVYIRRTPRILENPMLAQFIEFAE
ncbi:MAG: DUF835 domain-containing protein [Euryarchaeota archaeon]|nr:DUF835 domain-containing protein [Euryarchaeota archaeon]